MNQADGPVPADGDRLLDRMIVLARLSERIGHFDPRRVLLEKMFRQVLLFSRMSERLGIAAPESPLMRAVLREIELGCLECTAWRQCRRWLDGGLPGADYRDFCPNEGLFAVLPRQEDVKRPCPPT